MLSRMHPLLRPLAALAVAATVLALSPAPQSAADDGHWPRWRGPDGRGVAPGTSYADDWAPDRNIAWKAPVEGSGHSSPVIWGHHLFVTTSIRGGPSGHTPPDHLGYDLKPGYRNPDSEEGDRNYTLKVLAYDTRSGALLWDRTAYDGLMWDDRHRKNTYASSTIVTDGDDALRVLRGARPLRVRLQRASWCGRRRWATSRKAGMGPGTSPILFENLVVLQIDQEMGAGSAIVALDKKTGKEVWRTERTHAAHVGRRRSSSRRAPAPELMAHGRRDGSSPTIPRTGRELWHATGLENHPIPSAVAGHGLVYSLSRISPQARAGRAARRRRRPHRHRCGRVALQQGDRLRSLAHPARALSVSHDRGGILTCLDALTGAVVYEGGRPPVPGTYRSSLVAVGDRCSRPARTATPS